MPGSARARPASAWPPSAARPRAFTGILITHEHSDHINGLAVLAAQLHVPVYCNRDTKSAIEFQIGCKFDCRIFATGASFEVGDVMVDTFSIPHDASDPVGFLLRTSAGNIGFLTDLGHATKLALERVRAANVLVLETNHDLKLLQDPEPPLELETAHPRPSWPPLQRRRRRCRAGDHVGRLAAPVPGPPEPRVQPAELAHQVMRERLQKIGATHVKTELTNQFTPCPTLKLG